MKPVLLIAVIALVLAGCRHATPPHLETVCMESHLVLVPYPIWIGKILTIQYLPQTVCDKTAKRCVWGRDWQGPQKCE